MFNHTPDDIQGTSLFDCYGRTDRSGGRHAETTFEFFNRSAWRSAEIARATLESWYANVPLEKKADLRGRFRGDDRRHSSALLELVAHEILSALADEVQPDPDFNGGRPDFSAVYGNTRLIVECTVAQESDLEFGALQRERAVLDAVNSVRSGHFGLKLEPHAVGDTQPSLRKLRKFLEKWLESLSAQSHSTLIQAGSPFESTIWKSKGWELRFEAIPFGFPVEGGPLGIIQWPVRTIMGEATIGRALDKKAEKYRRPQVPYLIVAAERESIEGPEVILDALLGRTKVIIGPDGLTQTRTFDGLWGAPSHPRNCHVSAVLYKHRMKDAWSICSQIPGTSYFDDACRTTPSWQLVHNPAADVPLPRGIFPFATEHVWFSEQLTPVAPTRTLNDVLGLPDPWPGEEH